jgi:membrane protein involved in colicin uptake
MPPLSDDDNERMDLEDDPDIDSDEEPQTPPTPVQEDGEIKRLQAATLEEKNVAIERRICEISEEFEEKAAAGRELIVAEQRAMAEIQAKRAAEAAARESACIALEIEHRAAQKAAAVARKKREEEAAAAVAAKKSLAVYIDLDSDDDAVEGSGGGGAPL